MRIVALLLALYMAVLGCLSCTEEEPCLASGPTVATMQSLPAHRPTPAADWCSPLCQCHCCPGFALPQPISLLVTGPRRPGQDAARFRAWVAPGVLTRHPAVPWQPPQGV